MMSVSGMVPFKFERWLTRLQYSEFIHQTYKNIRNRGILCITEFHYSVISVSKNNNDFIISGDNGNTVNARKVVMYPGAQLSDMFPEFNGISGLINHFSQYNPTIDETVIIAASSLAAIDAFRYIYNSAPRTHTGSRAEISVYALICVTGINPIAGNTSGTRDFQISSA